MEPLVPIPTNLITGFLGMAKGTAILNLLENRSGKGRWAAPGQPPEISCDALTTFPA